MKTETQEEFTVKGDEVLKKIRAIIAAGNIRRISIKNEEGKTLIEVPLTVGTIGVILLPVFAAIGAVAALLTHCTIVVTKELPSNEA